MRQSSRGKRSHEGAVDYRGELKPLGNHVGRPPTMTAEDKVFVWRLHQKGLTCRAIARLASRQGKQISHDTINRFCKRAELAPEAIVALLKSMRLEAIEAWELAMKRGARDGRHAPAKDLLQATGDITRDEPADRFIILVGDGTAPVAQLPEPPQAIIDAAEVTLTETVPVPEPDPQKP